MTRPSKRLRKQRQKLEAFRKLKISTERTIDGCEERVLQEAKKLEREAAGTATCVAALIIGATTEVKDLDVSSSDDEDDEGCSVREVSNNKDYEKDISIVDGSKDEVSGDRKSDAEPEYERASFQGCETPAELSALPAVRRTEPTEEIDGLTAIKLTVKEQHHREKPIWLTFGSEQLNKLKNPLGARREILLFCINETKGEKLMLAVDDTGFVDMTEPEAEAPVRMVYNPVDGSKHSVERLEAAFTVKIRPTSLLVEYRPSDKKLFGHLYGRFKGSRNSSCFLCAYSVPDDHSKISFLTWLIEANRQCKRTGMTY